MIDIFGIIKNAISVYKNNWKQIGIPFYLTIIIALITVVIAMIPCCGSIISIGLGMVSTMLVISAFPPIYAALKKKKIPNWNQNMQDNLTKSVIYTLLTMVIGLVVGSVLIGIVVLSVMGGIATGGSMMVLFAAVLGVIVFAAMILILLWTGFLLPEYVIAKNSITDSVKNAISLYRNNLGVTILFNLVLGIIATLLSLIPVILIAAIVAISIFAGWISVDTIITGLSSIKNASWGENLAYNLAFNVALVLVFGVYSVLFITPWVYTAWIDFWDQLKRGTGSKKPSKSRKK